MGCTSSRTEKEVPSQESNSSPDKPVCGNDESSPPSGPSGVLSWTGPSTSPNNGNVQNNKRRSPCKEEEEESCQTKRSKADTTLKKRKSKSKHGMALWKKVWLKKTGRSSVSPSDVDESVSENMRLIEEQNKQERFHMRRSAPSCSNDASSSTPGPSGVLSCTDLSMAPNSGTKRKSPCSEQEDEEQSSSRKKSKADDAPKKRKFKVKHDLALWKKVWLKKTDRSRLSSSDVDESGSEANKRPTEEQKKQELQDSSSSTCKKELSSLIKRSKTHPILKRIFNFKRGLALWKKVWLKKTAKSRISSSSVDKSSSEEESEYSYISLIIKEQMEQETQADSTLSGEEELRKKYMWGEMLQEGGNGQVFRGVRIEDNLPVALKFMSKSVVMYTDVEMDGVSVTLPEEVYFLIRAGAGPTSSDSRLTPQLLDWYDLDHKIVLVLERPVPCKDLFDYVSDMGGISPNLAKIIFRQLVDQAIELESKGIFHRDIKPENVLLDTGSDVPRARFIDFGCATFFTPGQKFNDPQGTTIYCPPEWFRENKYRAGPTTAWQMGMILYVMLFKRIPLTREESIASKRKVPIPTRVPAECRDLLKGCLEKNPKKRLSLQSIRDHPWLNSE